MDLAAASALMSAAVGGVTLATVIFRSGRQTQKIDQMDASVGRLDEKLDSVAERLESKLNGHIMDSGDHHAVVGERLARVEARTEV